MEDYREEIEYKALEKILTDAGMKIVYRTIKDDSIDGKIWAYSADQGETIYMPKDPQAFPNYETACVILGHEAGHILSGLGSPDFPPDERIRNEAVCDLIGVYLFKLAEMTAGHQEEIRNGVLTDE